jgi:hypothetical protein
MKIKNKKSQIGSTLTWFAALIIILIVMMIFIAGVMAIKSTKTKQEATSLKAYSTDSSKMLLAILNLEVEGKGKVGDLIKEWYSASTNEGDLKQSIETKIKEYVNSIEATESKDYIFYVGKTSQSFIRVSSDNSEYFLTLVDSNLLKRAAKVYIFSGTNKAEIKFYYGEF